MSASPSRRTLRGLAAYVRPAFMLPAVGMSAVGGLLAPTFEPLPAALHAAAVGLALYAAHLNDGYVDAHVRGEEEPKLSRRGNRSAVAATTLVLLVTLGGLAATAGPASAVVTAPLWLLAAFHAPYLDVHPLTVTTDYPLGIGLVLVGGYLAQATTLSALVAAVAVVFVVLLSGVKISVDRLDYAFDRSIGKRTVPVAVGEETAAVASAAVLTFASVLVGGFVTVGVFPPAAATAAAFPALAGVAGLAVSTERAVRFQMLLTYPFTAILVAACCTARTCALGAALLGPSGIV
ncbi:MULTISPECIES: UbiA family prenyltransferase [Halorussus]|uniref:UbiA family prenyltransferase n=1 Tax=Halorussus TaxID=1070314 RepID=UPI0020A07613|nr:UbiA family prenyltransferase [Halorussus vallis]USZ77823.1 ubiquinone biosynthesis protein UbiA [Halorussus vallis]